MRFGGAEEDERRAFEDGGNRHRGVGRTRRPTSRQQVVDRGVPDAGSVRERSLGQAGKADVGAQRLAISNLHATSTLVRSRRDRATPKCNLPGVSDICQYFLHRLRNACDSRYPKADSSASATQ